MYSKNDYRYYLEHQLMLSDDYLAHYGVKGMKWKIRKINYNTGDTRGRGIELANDSSRQSYGIHYATWNVKNDKGKALVYTKQNPNVKNTGKIVDKTRGRVNTFGDKSYKEITVDLSKKKKSKKNRVSSIRKKYGLYRTKPKGKKLRGSGNIYVSHN